MAALVFVLCWVALAIGLVIMGIRSGRRSRASDVNVSRGGRAHWYLGFALVVLLFGVGLPLASSLGQDDNSERVPEANINSLTDGEEHGRELFVRYCSQCHTLAGASAVAGVGPNLDELRPTAGLLEDAIKNGRARGNGAMAANLVTGEDLEDVVAFVTKAVGQDEQPAE